MKNSNLNLPNPKSRGNWGGFWRGNYERIFGHSDPIAGIDNNGSIPKDKCQSDDFEYSRRLDKVLAEHKRFTNPNDQKKIDNEFFGRQQEYRNGVVVKELKKKYGY